MLAPALLALLLVACSTPAQPPPPPPVAPEPAPDPVPVAPAGPTPASLYAECRDRVEGPQEEGECSGDADCSSTGCSKEMCVTAAEAPDMMTTCEALPCFQILDTCGCREGVCAWTLKEAVP